MFGAVGAAAYREVQGLTEGLGVLVLLVERIALKVQEGGRESLSKANLAVLYLMETLDAVGVHALVPLCARLMGQIARASTQPAVLPLAAECCNQLLICVHGLRGHARA